MTPSTVLEAPQLGSWPTSSAFRRATPRLLLGSLVLGVLTRWAFAAEPGLGFTVWTLAVIAGFAVVGGREARQRGRAASAWAVAALFFAGMEAIRDSAELTFFNIAATLGLLLLAAADLAWAEAPANLGAYVAALARAVGGTVRGSAALTADASRQAVTGLQRAPGPLLGVARGLLMAFPVVGLLGWLLVSGDKAFDEALGQATRTLPDAILTSTSWLVWSLAGAAAVGGGWTYALRRRDASPIAAAPRRVLQVGATEGIVVLASVVALFAAFLAVQVSWLFSMDPSARDNGLTYAGYAHRGFGELTVVALLTWGLVELARSRLRSEGRAQQLAVRALATVALVQALVLLGSAHWRLALYDDAYGLTVTRLFAHAAITFFGGSLVVRAVTLWVAARHTGTLVVAVALGVLAGLDVMNPDAVVVRVNLHRDRSVVPLDFGYLATLSADAAVALEPLFAAGLDEDTAPLLGWRCRFRGGPDLASLNLGRARAASIDLGLACPEPSWEHVW